MVLIVSIAKYTVDSSQYRVHINDTRFFSIEILKSKLIRTKSILLVTWKSWEKFKLHSNTICKLFHLLWKHTNIRSILGILKQNTQNVKGETNKWHIYELHNERCELFSNKIETIFYVYFGRIPFCMQWLCMRNHKLYYLYVNLCFECNSLCRF